MIKLVKTAHAQLQNPIAANSLLGLLERLVDVLIQYGVVIAMFFVIYSGFLFVTARGNEEKIKSAKKTFLYTIIGSTVLLGASVIVTVIKATVETL